MEKRRGSTFILTFLRKKSPNFYKWEMNFVQDMSNID